MDLDQRIRQQEHDGGDVIPSVTQDTTDVVFIFHLDFTVGASTYAQAIYAETLIDANRIALETIETVTAWEGPAQSMTLREIRTV